VRFFLLAGFLAASTCYAQIAPLNILKTQSESQNQGANGATITVPSGTHVALSLASPITTKSRKGDAVRAAVAFPVTVGNQVAIPAGTYAQGVIAGIVKHSSNGPSVQMKFSSMVFSNGYTVALDGSNLQAKLTDTPADQATPGGVAGASAGYALNGKAQASPPPPPLMPPSMPGPNKGLIIGLSVGGAAAVLVTAIALGHRSGPAARGDILFNTGWQFNMVLNSPLTLNASSIARVSPNK
jgi:hypothetical protein